MGRITVRRPVLRVSTSGTRGRRPDTLAVEEPLEIRVAGKPLTITMRTPGHDFDLVAGLPGGRGRDRGRPATWRPCGTAPTPPSRTRWTSRWPRASRRRTTP
ncbi:hypothetical protein LUX39_05510 [Actinomadura madurae]|nr:hypothetical protein [Actinomadura madurae]MCQ0013331.1 hypothetical protein [Actinomadura madurae]